MNDIEKTISLLKEIADYFYECRDNASFGSKAEEHFWELQMAAKDAIELINYQHEHIEAFLADQKPVEVEYKRIDDDYQAIEDEFTCKRCGALWMIPKEDLRYCPKCGRAVKLDG